MTYTVTELLSELDDVLAALDVVPPAETLRLVWPDDAAAVSFSAWAAASASYLPLS